MANINFSKQASGLYESEFKAESDFALHLVFKGYSNIEIGITPVNDKNYDFDSMGKFKNYAGPMTKICQCGVYPMYVKVRSSEPVDSATFVEA